MYFGILFCLSRFSRRITKIIKKKKQQKPNQQNKPAAPGVAAPAGQPTTNRPAAAQMGQAGYPQYSQFMSPYAGSYPGWPPQAYMWGGRGAGAAAYQYPSYPYYSYPQFMYAGGAGGYGAGAGAGAGGAEEYYNNRQWGNSQSQQPGAQPGQAPGATPGVAAGTASTQATSGLPLSSYVLFVTEK